MSLITVGSLVEIIIDERGSVDRKLNGSLGYVCSYNDKGTDCVGVSFIKETLSAGLGQYLLHNCDGLCFNRNGRFFGEAYLRFISPALAENEEVYLIEKESNNLKLSPYISKGYNFFNEDGKALILEKDGKRINASHGDLAPPGFEYINKKAEIGDRVLCFIKNKFAEKGSVGTIVEVDHENENDMCAVKWDMNVGGTDLSFLGIEGCPEGHGEITFLSNILLIEGGDGK